VYRLTPDLKLVARRAGPDQPAALLGEAKKVLRDLAACATA
jgi:transcription-repair coupling factor (superfamily II helicase)